MFYGLWFRDAVCKLADLFPTETGSRVDEIYSEV
jgi:hypothetical protein